MRSHVHGERFETRRGWATLRYVTPGLRYQVTCAYSEAACWLGWGGRLAHVTLTDGGMAQLHDPATGRDISFPILPGEAGLYRDGDEFYLYEPDTLPHPDQEAA